VVESTKVKVFRLLAENSEGFVSGATLAYQLQVSRNAIWKSVESLRSEGHDITAINNKGYRLEKSGSSLTEVGMAMHLETIGIFQIEMRKTVTSTNTVLREMAQKGAPEGLVLVAEEQTSGKGRHGRAFFSPAGHGAYFSLLLRPGSKAGDAALITSAAAVATAQAIEEVTGIRVGIKWVNDLCLDKKKVCGILTEATFGIESGIIESVILGIGINVTRPEKGYPGTLEDVARPLKDVTVLTKKTWGKEDKRCRLIAKTLDNFWKYYLNLAGREFLDEYRARSIVLGRSIYVLSGDERVPAHALSIDDDCRLIVRYKNGETAALNSGEVSVRV